MKATPEDNVSGDDPIEVGNYVESGEDPFEARPEGYVDSLLSSLVLIKEESDEQGSKLAVEDAEEETDHEMKEFMFQENIHKERKKSLVKVSVRLSRKSAYEKLRERNIIEREAALQASGLLEDWSIDAIYRYDAMGLNGGDRKRYLLSNL